MSEMDENKSTPLKMPAERQSESQIEAEFESRMEALFEQRLSAALERVDAPAGFAERVVQRASGAQERPPAKVVAMPRRTHVWMTGSIAAALLLGALLGGDADRRHEHAVADRDFAISQRITEQTLEQTRQQLAEHGIRLDD